MWVEWHVSKGDLQKLKRFLVDQDNSDTVVERIKRNLGQSRSSVSKDEFWQTMVSARLTSVQRSGRTSPVSKFIARKPFPLSYTSVSSIPDASGKIGFISHEIRQHGGIRFPDRIAEDLSTNFDSLNRDDLWKDMLDLANGLIGNDNQKEERRVANFVAARLQGFGPKQSRNLLQMLGLTRYEIPLDSRVTRWLKQFDFPLVASANGLSDPKVYEHVLDGIQVLCSAAQVYPTKLDAAIFASFE